MVGSRPGRASARQVSRRTRLAGAVTGSLILTAGICTVGAGTASAADPVTETFGYTGGAQSWTVPAGVTRIHVVADGAQGGRNGGVGARVSSDLAVAGGQTLDIYVGGAGGNVDGGFNGGGRGALRERVAWYVDSGGGGGASDIRSSGGSPSDRLMVAAGGGGSAGGYPSRAAGGSAGADGSDGANGIAVTGGQGGKAGTASGGGAGGASGAYAAAWPPGTAGELAVGGNGGNENVSSLTGTNSGGGGGGGLFGGGGGGSGTWYLNQDHSGGGGGGGGSSLDPDGGPAPTPAPAGNGQVTVTYTIPYDFTGFYAPVDAAPALNQMNAGRTVPVKFSLDGDKGLDILAAGSPTSRQIECATNAPVDMVETTTTSNSGLTYDSASQQYQYNWKTEKAWSGTCREFTLTLDDGISHTANFQFK
uniref:receptor protein-tyrosine kinase n=1 Tax=Streptomyces sp. NBC_00180 TaxID=2903632 RepID=A0AAU1HMP6_9ACTN